MKSASHAFKRAMAAGAPLLCYADIVTANGVKLSFGPDDDFLIDGNSISDGSGSSGFPLGAAVAKTVTINIDNSDDRYSAYDFYMARVTAWTGIDLDDGTTERIREGTFTVIDAVTPGETLEINAINDMYKADITYVPSVTLPTDLITILRDVCSQCDMLLGSPTFRNQDYKVYELPTGTTCRAVIGYIAQIGGGNAYCDANNRLIIKPYDLSVFETLTVVDGRSHDETVPDTVDGGDFNDSIADQVDGGVFGEGEGYHSLYDWTSLTVATDDVVITGVATEISTDDDDETYLYGIDGYTINIDNPLIKGNEKDAVNRIGAVVVGIIVRPFEGEHTAYALADFMDPCIVWDKKDNMYPTFLTDINFEYVGTTSFRNSTEPPLRNRSNYYSNATEAYRKARNEADKMLKKQKAEWEKAMEDLGNRLENSPGLYTTIDKKEDGSSIFYMHDKRTLAESTIVWKQTAEAWGVSTDGGKTWNAGMTVDGDVIARILNTIGVNADWIRTGTLDASLITAGKARSTNYKKGESGMEIDFDTGAIYRFWNGVTTSFVGGGFSAQTDAVDSNYTLIGMQVDDKHLSYRVAANANGFSVYDTQNAAFIYDMRIDTSNRKVTTNINGKTGRTGRAEFSDGTYLEFNNGILVGGWTEQTGGF